MSRCIPVRDSSWVCDVFFEAMGAKSSESNGRCAVDATDGPEWDRHG